MQSIPLQQGTSIHISADISWYHKGELRFYHDELDRPRITVEKPTKPRRRPKSGNEEEYQERVCQWEANLPHDPDIESSGNSMTMEYYTQHQLPDYCERVNWLRLRYGRGILQEDGDSSHGKIRSKEDVAAGVENIATQLKNDNWIETLEHPAQSPDLNPIEAIWNLLNERVHQRDWRDQYELRTVIEEEWKRITLEEIRARIAEMPWRCRMLREGNHTKLINSKLW